MNYDKFLLGINYWPAKKAMYWWENWEQEEVEEDFSQIAELGFDKIRLFLLWEDFQPEAHTVCLNSVYNLIKTLEVAQKNGLGIMPTFFVGHMSGFNWIPSWMVANTKSNNRFNAYSSKRILDKNEYASVNYYKSQELMESQIYQVREVAKALRNCPALWGWDLGNEPSNFAKPQSKKQGENWIKRVVETLKEVDKNKVVTIGMHMEDLEQDRKMGPWEAAKYCDFICMHGYPIYTSWAEGETDSDLLPFLALITGWLGQKPVLFQEFGLATSFEGNTDSDMLVSDETAAKYYQEVLIKLHNVGCLGAFAWCYSDYHQSIWNLPPLSTVKHERYFGLWREDGSMKPALEAISNFKNRDILSMDFNPNWININKEDFYKNPLEHLKNLYHDYKLIKNY